MKKNLLLCLLLAGCWGRANAQDFSSAGSNDRFCYLLEMSAGYGVALGATSVDNVKVSRITAEIINGVNMGDYFSMGLGVGINVLRSDGQLTVNQFKYKDPIYDKPYMKNSLPTPVTVFADFKGYLPLGASRKSYLYFAVDIGTALKSKIQYYGTENQGTMFTSSLYFACGPGFKAGGWLDLGVRYQSLGYWKGAVVFQVGFYLNRLKSPIRPQVRYEYHYDSYGKRYHRERHYDAERRRYYYLRHYD